MIKYLGSKRTLVPVLGSMATALGVARAVDLFTGTTRVAQEFKRRGIEVTAADVASYSRVLSDCYIATDATTIDTDELDAEIDRLQRLPATPGYVTATFCEQARYFQPKNGARIDAIRDELHTMRDHRLFPILLTSLIEAADRVDSTTGLQMAYLKQWAPRAHNDLRLRRPDLIAGPGSTVVGDVDVTIDTLPATELMYLDPPYNQHRYFTNYHIWETLVRWDAPAHYGVACKRIDAREGHTRSVFNSRRTMPAALRSVIERARAEVLIVSYNNESWIGADELMGWLREAGHQDVRMLAFDSRRYVGAQIGVHNRTGERVGTVSHLRNTELLFVAGPTDRVQAAVAAGLSAPSSRRTGQTAPPRVSPR